MPFNLTRYSTIIPLYQETFLVSLGKISCTHLRRAEVKEQQRKILMSNVLNIFIYFCIKNATKLSFAHPFSANKILTVCMNYEVCN